MRFLIWFQYLIRHQHTKDNNMTKTEFKRLIHEAEADLAETYWSYEHSGVCISLRYAHHYLNGELVPLDKIPTVVLFEKTTKPRNDDSEYWFGSRKDEHNIHVRMIALRLFEQYVLSEKLYLKL